MIARLAIAGLLAAAAATAFGAEPAPAVTETSPAGLAEALSYPFVGDLTSAQDADRLAWVTDQQGIRAVWTAAAPDFHAVALYRAKDDDGQELTGLVIVARRSARRVDARRRPRCELAGGRGPAAQPGERRRAAQAGDLVRRYIPRCARDDRRRRCARAVRRGTDRLSESRQGLDRQRGRAGQARACLLRQRKRRFAGVVARWEAARLRVAPRRSQSDRGVFGQGHADHLAFALDGVRRFAGVVA